jgi:hypothetical protein
MFDSARFPIDRPVMSLRSIISLSIAANLACAADEPARDGGRAPVEPQSLPAPDQPMAPVKPTVERIDETRFRIGDVTFDQKTREIRFPAAVNMTEGLLEFLVVHENGKIHEALFHTRISPTHLNLAFKLLRYPPSDELYALPNEKGGLSSDFPEVSEDVRAGARVNIQVEWQDAGKTRKVSVNEWIQHAVKGDAMPPEPWVYGGSRIYDGKYVPETTGDIAAIYITGSALINYPGEDNRDDTVWLSFPKRVPPEGTRVTLIITPHQPVKS